MVVMAMQIFYQSVTQPGSTAGNLRIANNLGFAVVIVGLLLLILFIMHYYRMIGSRDSQGKKGKETWDPVSQYEFMSREDLKAMALKEKAEKEKKVDMSDLKDLSEAGTEPAPGDVVKVETGKDETAYQGPDAAFISAEAELLAKLLLPSDGEIEEARCEEKTEEYKKPKHKYSDLIERSILSTDLPEELEGKPGDEE